MTAASPGSPGQGVPPPAPPSHSRARGLRIGAIVAVLAFVGGAAIWHFATAHQGGSIVLPDRLLGTTRYTGPGATVFEHRIENTERAASNGVLDSPVAAIYGYPVGHWFSVVAGQPCTSGSCVIGTAGQFAQILRAHGYAYARSFAPGPGGDIMVCFSQSIRSAMLLHCVWIDPSTAGEAIFAGGTASSLADAAAKTRQIRAAIDH